MQTINISLLAGILALAAPAYMAAQGSDAARKDTMKKDTMLPQKPDDWRGLFTRHLNAGDLKALAGLVRTRTTALDVSDKQVERRRSRSSSVRCSTFGRDPRASCASGSLSLPCAAPRPRRSAGSDSKRSTAAGSESGSGSGSGSESESGASGKGRR